MSAPTPATVSAIRSRWRGMARLPDPGDVAMVAEAEKRFGRVDLLVNNAAIRINRLFGEFTVAEFDQAVAVNLRAPFLASQAVLPAMRRQGGGRIVHVASQL